MYTKLAELISNSFPQLRLEKIDTVEEPELSAKYKVYTSPIIVLLLDGKEFLRTGGNISIHELKQKIERLFILRFGQEH